MNWLSRGHECQLWADSGKVKPPPAAYRNHTNKHGEWLWDSWRRNHFRRGRGSSFVLNSYYSLSSQKLNVSSLHKSVSEADTDTVWGAPTMKWRCVALPSTAGGTTATSVLSFPVASEEYSVLSRQRPGRRREGEPLKYAWNSETLMASATACDWHATEARKCPAVTTQEGRAAVPSPSLGGREARAPWNLQDRAPVGEPGPAPRAPGKADSHTWTFLSHSRATRDRKQSGIYWPPAVYSHRGRPSPGTAPLEGTGGVRQQRRHTRQLQSRPGLEILGPALSPRKTSAFPQCKVLTNTFGRRRADRGQRKA